MKRTLSVAFLSGLLAGCAMAHETYTPTGQKGFSINCSGAALSWGLCYEKAGEMCGSRGYTVLNATGDSGQILTANQFGLYSTPTISRNLLVQCN